MMKLFSIFTLLALSFAFKADKPAYKIVKYDGKKASYGDVLKNCAKADVVLFGELHNSSIAHWLQLELTKDLIELNKQSIVLGAEMFENDDQLVLNEYLSGQIEARHFEKECKLWNNYSTDYKPLLNLAKENDLPFIATNIPRRYASMVALKGFDALMKTTDEAKSYVAPLPIEVDSTLPGYNQLLKMGMGPHGNSENFMNAQAIKDATMAHNILQNWQKGKTFVHYNGAYHSNNFEGISWYLKKQNPDLKIVTISCVELDDLDALSDEDKKLADFIISIPKTMTKTY